ncbi:YggS family pyridoxal phosphate-dependent enzyme [Roseivirga sp. BDSF3-8]|uniref:YggS family pyridoxal phosphate-dependent enzyme n=1 Tax=Roseivirga sp. BDSF3-8 TaxID=3241598 RepID=UPI0035325B99
MNIRENIERFTEELEKNGTRLCAVSKTKPVEDIKEAYEAGQRVFGENKAQEMAAKQEELPDDIQWHMIGHLQRNKVKYIAPFVSLIHSVDSERLLREVNKQGAKAERVIPCLLQVHIAEEETKFGLDREEVLALLKPETLQELPNVEIRGLMGMATNTDDEALVRKEFKSLKGLFDEIKENHSSEQVTMKELSMGMSGDYQIAMEEGSTLVRIGSAIFGARNYD